MQLSFPTFTIASKCVFVLTSLFKKTSSSSSYISSMEDVQSWLAKNDADHSNNSIFSSSSSATTSQETHNTPTLCDHQDTSSFNSLKSNAATKTSPNNYSVSYRFVSSINTKTPQISCLAVQNNNLYAASTKEINVFDSTTLSLIDTFGSGSYSGRVKSIAFSGTKIFTAHQDCKIRVWQMKVMTSSSSSTKQTKHKLIQTIPTFKDRFINCMLPKNYVQIRRHKQKLWIEHADVVSGLAVISNKDVGLMYSVSWDKSFKIWNISADNNIRCLESVEAHSDAVNVVVVNPLDGTVYTGSANGEIKVWIISEETKKHKLLTTLTKHTSSVNALALTTNGSILFSGGGDRVILVWERGNKNSNNDENNNHLFVGCCLKGHNGAILCLVCVNRINGVVISGSSDRSVRIWKYGNEFGGCCLGVLEGHCKPVKSLVVIPRGGELLDDSFSVISGSLDGEIRAWKVVVSDESD